MAVQKGENIDVLHAPALLGEAALCSSQYAEAGRRACGFRAQVQGLSVFRVSGLEFWCRVLGLGVSPQ